MASCKPVTFMKIDLLKRTYSEAATGVVLQEKMILNILQNSREITCA